MDARPDDVVDGWAAAAQMSDGIFTDLVLGTLTEHPDEWDRPARLYAVVMGGTDEMVEQAVRSADPSIHVQGRGRGRVSIDGQPGVAFGVALAGEIAGHPYDHLVGLDVPAEVAALVLVSEAWATAIGDGPLEGYTDEVVVDERGRAEIRMATAVDRFGRTANGHLVRGGGTSVTIESADTMRLPASTVSGSEPDQPPVVMMSGRLVDALRCCMGLHGRPLTSRPWLWVASRWCDAAVHNLPAAEKAGNVDELVAMLTVRRPDVVTAMYGMVSTAARQRVGAAGLSMDDPRAEAIIADTPRPELPQDPRLLVERCDELVADSQPLRPAIGWRTAAMPVRLHPPMYGMDQATVVWWDDQSLINAIGGLTDADAEESVARLRATAGRWPDWFTDSALAFTRQAGELVCDPAPIPDPPVG